MAWPAARELKRKKEVVRKKRKQKRQKKNAEGNISFALPSFMPCRPWADRTPAFDSVQVA